MVYIQLLVFLDETLVLQSIGKSKYQNSILTILWPQWPQKIKVRISKKEQSSLMLRIKEDWSGYSWYEPLMFCNKWSWHNFHHTHCLDLVLNGLLTRRNFWRIPGVLGNYTIPNLEKNWNRASRFWENPIYPLLST